MSTLYAVPDTLLQERRERVFLIVAGFFLGSMTMLNVIGLTKVIGLGPMVITVGVLPYPLTFLCTEIISEIYGRQRANFGVWVGFALNLFVVGMMYLCEVLPEVAGGPPWQTLSLAEGSVLVLPNGEKLSGDVSLFHIMYACTAGSVLASMVAYLIAQLCDVQLFHYFKRITKGKYLWLRNNGSTVISQFIDTVAVISIAFGAAILNGAMSMSDVGAIILGNYSFKLAVALLDTAPFYLIISYLRKYLEVSDPETAFVQGAALTGAD